MPFNIYNYLSQKCLSLIKLFLSFNITLVELGGDIVFRSSLSSISLFYLNFSFIFKVFLSSSVIWSVNIHIFYLGVVNNWGNEDLPGLYEIS